MKLNQQDQEKLTDLMQTTEKAQHWLGNRGLDYSIEEIRVHDDWIFVRDSQFLGDSDELIDCYKWDSTSIFAEAWDDISVADSPFVENNQARVTATVLRIEQSYQEYIKEYVQ